MCRAVSGVVGRIEKARASHVSEEPRGWMSIGDCCSVIPFGLAFRCCWFGGSIVVQELRVEWRYRVSYRYQVINRNYSLSKRCKCVSIILIGECYYNLPSVQFEFPTSGCGVVFRVGKTNNAIIHGLNCGCSGYFLPRCIIDV